MRFGLFYEHQLPRPWTGDSEERLLQDALEQVEIADAIGIDYVWEVEHHFLEEYSHSSAPEVFLAAASQRTRRIRLGHGIVQLPPAFNHPARVAERIATLDLISGGRVDFGTGEASSQAELGGFGVDRDLKRAQWEEALDVVTRMMVEEPFAGHRGRFLSVPPRNVVPKPKQKPHPPLWVACSRRETILLAARKGLGALSFSFVEPEEAKQWVDEYYALIDSDECIPGGFSVNPKIAVVVPFMCHRDESTAIERGIDGAHFFGYSLAHYYVFGRHQPGRTDLWRDFELNRTQRGFARDIVTAADAPLGMKLLQSGLGSLRGAIGTPAQVRELARRYQAAGVDQVILVAQAGRNRHEHVCESLRLFGEEVLPAFAADADRTERERLERLAPACERALSRRPPPREAPPGYTVTAQGEPWQGAPQLPGRDGRGRGLLSRYVRGRSDSQLERVIGSPLALRLLFTGMARSFQPERAAGFQGDVVYELRRGRKTECWTLSIRDGKASAVRAAAVKPAVTLRMAVPTFARMAAGELDPARAVMEGMLAVEGDFQVASRLSGMFGGPSPF
jgi:alkanesulfonate monooxygenase SsuD/methylene tetrahydromethanopterin reductase-like flavin-dependent oxidoreductase (luciferase family)/putative sterol carrier protein